MGKMIKRMLVFALIVLMVLPVLTSFAYAEEEKVPEGYSRMYVKTNDGKRIGVRAKPDKNSKLLGYAKYGEAVVVDWSYAGNDGWSKILWGSNGYGYVRTRYLVAEKPSKATATPKKATATPKKATATPKPTKSAAQEAEELKKAQNQLNKELKSEKEVTPYYVAVRPTRATGKVNFRVGPGTIATKITSYPADKELIVLAECTNWLRAKDPETNKTGYIYKKYTTRLDKKVADKTDGAQKLGKLSINGEFDLTCKLPDDYTLQVVNMRGESISASILPEDMTKPELYLDIAYDELYGETERINDMSAEELAVLEGTFTELDDVQISYMETGHGTKLLVAREVGAAEDYVKFLAIYKGYFIEFTMYPNPNTSNKTLTDEQVQMCVDFLTDVDFNPVQ